MLVEHVMGYTIGPADLINEVFASHDLITKPEDNADLGEGMTK